MATKATYICDVCGQAMATIRKTLRYDSDERLTYMTITSSGRESIYTDLCDKCYEEFLRWRNTARHTAMYKSFKNTYGEK